jgi:hypothetical protein
MSETILIFGYDEEPTRIGRNHAEQNRELQSRLWQTSHVDGSQIVRSLKHEWHERQAICSIDILLLGRGSVTIVRDRHI